MTSFDVSEGPRIIFMNTKLRGVSALGLSVGRDHSNTFLNVDGDFFNIKHLNGEGRLVAIDVWGAGGKKSADEQQDMQSWESKQVEKTRKVNSKKCIWLSIPRNFAIRSKDPTKTKKLFWIWPASKHDTRKSNYKPKQ